MKIKNQKFLRSVSVGSCLLARQYGFNVTLDAVESKFESGDLNDFSDLKSFFNASGIEINLLRISKKDLEKRSYIFPSIAILNGENAVIITSLKRDADGILKVQYIDPIDPTGNIEEQEVNTFLDQWTTRLVTVSRYTGHFSKDKFFDMSWFYPEFYRFKWVLVLTFFISLLLHTLSLSPIIYIQITLDKVLGYGATETLYVLTAGVVLTLIFNGILGFVKDYIIQHISIIIEARISGDLFDKMLELPLGKFQTIGSSDLEQTISAGSSIRTIVDRQILNNIFEAAGLLVFVPVLIGYSPILAGIVLLFSLVSALIGLFLRRTESDLTAAFASESLKKNQTLRETITGIDAVKVFSLESSQRKDWRHNTASAITAYSSRHKISNLNSALQSVFQQLMTVAIIFAGVMLVLSGGLSAGAIISCNMLGAKVVGPIKQIVMFVAELSVFREVVSQVAELWNAPSERSGVGGQKIVRGNLEFSNVNILFDNSPALENLSCSLSEGTSVGIVGPAGCGKTTFLRLIQGLLRPNTGVFTIDGVSYANLNIENYRSQVALISQGATYFSGTIESNLRRARPNISEREFQDALNWSGLNNIMDQFPEGLSTLIDQNASGISSSHRIIISLARALVSNPRILLFDEVFSNVDKALCKHILLNLENISRGRTFIMATHDIGLLTKFDKIVVLDGGTVIQTGSHNELIEKSDIYKELYDLDVEVSKGLG
ncbi:MAG: hypothetical protein CMM76_17675 [Rhodospirillaceae bacterium]|nr:hypothetical protein [Rhodospirillaceae bacterium]